MRFFIVQKAANQNPAIITACVPGDNRAAGERDARTGPGRRGPGLLVSDVPVRSAAGGQQVCVLRLNGLS